MTFFPPTLNHSSPVRFGSLSSGYPTPYHLAERIYYKLLEGFEKSGEEAQYYQQFSKTRSLMPLMAPQKTLPPYITQTIESMNQNFGKLSQQAQKKEYLDGLLDKLGSQIFCGPIAMGFLRMLSCKAPQLNPEISTYLSETLPKTLMSNSTFYLEYDLSSGDVLKSFAQFISLDKEGTQRNPLLLESLAEQLATASPPVWVVKEAFNNIKAVMLSHLVKVDKGNRTPMFEQWLKVAIDKLPPADRKTVYPPRFTAQLPALISALERNGYHHQFSPATPPAALTEAIRTINYDLGQARDSDAPEQYVSELLDEVRASEKAGPLLFSIIAMLGVQSAAYPQANKPPVLSPAAVAALSQQIPDLLSDSSFIDSIPLKFFETIGKFISAPQGEQGIQKQEAFIAALLKKLATNQFTGPRVHCSFCILRHMQHAAVIKKNAYLNTLFRQALSILPKNLPQPIEAPELDKQAGSQKRRW